MFCGDFNMDKRPKVTGWMDFSTIIYVIAPTHNSN